MIAVVITSKVIDVFSVVHHAKNTCVITSIIVSPVVEHVINYYNYFFPVLCLELGS